MQSQLLPLYHNSNSNHYYSNSNPHKLLIHQDITHHVHFPIHQLRIATPTVYTISPGQSVSIPIDDLVCCAEEQNTQESVNEETKKHESLDQKEDRNQSSFKTSIKAFLKRKQDQRKLRKVKNERDKLVAAIRAYEKALDTMDVIETITYLESVYREVGLLA